jgi:hypothetical protein
MLVGIPGWGGSGDFLRLFLFLKKRSIVSSGKRGNLGWTHNAKSPMWEFVPVSNIHEYNWSDRRDRTQVMAGRVHVIASEYENEVSG